MAKERQQAEEEWRGRWGLMMWIPIAYRGWASLFLHIVLSVVYVLPWRQQWLGSRKRAAVAGALKEGVWPKGIRRKSSQNTCYVNSFVQFLFHAPGVKRKVMEAAAVVPPASTRGERPLILLALAQIFRDLDDGSQSPASASPLLKAMGIKTEYQQDAHEFGRRLLTAPGLESVAELFSGYLANVIQCTEIELRSESMEPFSDLALEVGSGDLQKALSRFTQSEVLADGWDTGGYGIQASTRNTSFLFLPPLLQIQLKRFMPGELTSEKLNGTFKFPTELDISCGSISAQYALTGVIMHSGTAKNGHFYSFVRVTRGKWYKIDNSNISIVSIDDAVLSKGFGGPHSWSSAYVLQYSKV